MSKMIKCGKNINKKYGKETKSIQPKYRQTDRQNY